jgi:branched-chain amino acid transport system substrate-binding protein
MGDFMATRLTRRASLAAAAVLAAPGIVRAQGAALKIGFITTLSGPGGYTGADVRDGMLLAARNDMLGGVKVRFVAEDDGLKPAQAKQIANRYLKTDGIRLFTGIMFSNVLEAVAPDVLDEGGIYVSPNAAPSGFAGKNCHRNYYVCSWQNDSLHESAGQYATRLGHKRMYVLAPNYPAGKDAITGFRRFFKGEVVGETYTRLDQTDYAPEMAQIRAADPDAVFQFHPGGLGIAFIRQYQQAGLVGKIPMVLAAPSLDSTTLAAVGEVALGMDVTSHWNADFDNPANREFVAAFQDRFKRLPTNYASQAYDTALAIGAALKATGGEIKDTERFRTAMLKADFASVRGRFRFGPNQHPVQDWFGLRAEKDAGGKLALATKGKVLSDHGDAYAALCRL